MIILPPSIAPPAPFPLVVSQSVATEFVAPGIRRAEYRLMTNAGPLVVYVVAVDPKEPTVHVRSVLANGRMISNGETVSAMATRTNAVAGVNADYFDIGNTNQPLNAVVHDGTLLRTPSKRVSLQIGTDASIGMGPLAFAGTVTDGANQLPLTTVNEWPPQGGVGLLTPAYGALTPVANTLVAPIEPVSGVAGFSGTYRIGTLAAPLPGPVTGMMLGFGPSAQRAGQLPLPGDLVQLAFDTTPALSSLDSVVGGGPLLVADGAPVDDPNSPAPEEKNTRFPVSGAAVTSSGTLLLFAVDGRHAAVSIGLTRPEFGALMRGFGAASGMAFDSGGSATLVARQLGDASVSVLNEPSDGRERSVADGVFVYSDAPAGLHPHLVVRPATFTALAGTTIAFTGAIVDDAGHRIRAAAVTPLVVDAAGGTRSAVVRDRDAPTMTASVPYRAVGRVASLAIVPDRPNPTAFAHVRLAVRAFDAAGMPVLLGTAPVRWDARAGASDVVTNAPELDYVAAGGDATIGASVGGARATTLVRVGVHSLPIGSFTERALPYDFTGNLRAAYSALALDLPNEPKTVSLDVFGDGSGIGVRAALLNRFGERVAVTVARRMNWQGWQKQTFVLPPDLNPPVRLISLYVVPSLGGPPVHAAGTVRFRALSVVVPGSK